MVLSRILRAGEGRTLKHVSKVADKVNELGPSIADLTDAQLRAKTDEFRERYAKMREVDDEDDGATDFDALEELMPEAFAVAREAATRVLQQRHFDVQLKGGAALFLGNVSEMKTGEGKTLTAVLPSYLNAISGNGVHVVTVNDYLAKRDAEWMGRIHRFLGLEVGVILSQMSTEERRRAYKADITYGTNNEFGFDYLRDNMASGIDQMVQRGHNFAIVDEVDSILIDEARTPLIISGPADQSSRWYIEFARIVERMDGIDVTGMAPREKDARAKEIADKHYEVDRKRRTIGVSEKGVAFVEDQLGIDNLYDAGNTPLVGYLNNAIKAKELYLRDKDYLVRDGEVLIVDEFTGRVLAGRRYSEGMHQAIEAKEQRTDKSVEIKAENQTLATITLQNYFRLYDRLSGMTGTAETEAAEFWNTYKLHVVPIPTNRPMVRVDRTDLIYKTEPAKFEALADDIAERHEKGQPVLVGTTSVERSEYLSKLLVKRKIPHNVLNAKHHEKESAIIAEAGHAGAVTVATNMAGRGTDIVLGGNPDHLAEKALRDKGLDPIETPEEWYAALPDALERAREEVRAEAEQVREAGGLYVLGTERHESRRIDNQLRGRSGRQGDPGESRFYLSLGDELMRRFNAQFVERVMTTMRVPDDQPIEAKMVSKAIKSAQTQVEQQNFEARKNLLKYDEVMNQQRKEIYANRMRVLEGEDLRDHVDNMMEEVVGDYIQKATADGYAEDWDHEKLWSALKELYPISLTWDQLTDEMEDRGDDLTAENLREAILTDIRRAYREREADINSKVPTDAEGQEGMRRLERIVMLDVLDRKWREHLYEMDYLKDGIGLRAMAQRDPLIEYQREGYDMFNTMLDGLKEECITLLFRAQVAEPQQAGQPQQQPAAAPAARAQQAAARATTQPKSTPPPPARQEDKIPPALRGGLRPSEQQYTYSGPAEGGGVQSRGGQSNGGNGQKPGQSGATRRERRAAARDAAKKGKKGTRR
ncbi:preprotein translocase subunit SecA [Actinophytocola gossypii]|uniref:Protein translocase subunit SecA n=1 Tax=Actinophytocola gossypii TaxID=2812003 RepID=A0ABT2JEG1_9PSEU|nr:preprotein translocase subunit SecA [Actinophytocola gossypii]MCT2586260.1 preprotein translocase subunit SecA [Actinophytocola gossypii]